MGRYIAGHGTDDEAQEALTDQHYFDIAGHGTDDEAQEALTDQHYFDNFVQAFTSPPPAWDRVPWRRPCPWFPWTSRSMLILRVCLVVKS
jgi:hypothetical protein